MSAMKRLIENIYDDYKFEGLSVEQLSEKYHVEESVVNYAINMMSEALKGWED